MKVIIWIGCFFVVNAVIVAARMFAGISLGGIPAFILYGCMFFGAKKLCAMWDHHKDLKKLEDEINNERKD